MYKKILVPYDKSDPAKNALGAALDLAAGVPGAQITVLSVVDWHDFNAETFKIASRMSGVMGDTMDMDVISEVENEAIKADMDAIADMACKKLVHRHPHVFGEVAADTPEKVRPMPTRAVTTASSWAIAVWVPCVGCSAACATPCCTRPTCPCSL